MGKINAVLRKVVFLWGAISLTVIVGFTIFFAISNLFSYRAKPTEEESIIHEKTTGGTKFFVKRQFAPEGSQILLTLSEKGKSLVSNYRLPLDKNEWFEDVKDSTIIAADTDQYRISMLTVANDCEESNYRIFFLKYDGKMSLIGSESFTDMNRLRNGTITGHKHFYLPYVKGFDNNHFVVPIEIRYDKSAIIMTPLLNEQGIRLIKSEFEEGLKEREEKLKKAGDQGQLKSFAETCRAFPAALHEKSIAW